MTARATCACCGYRSLDAGPGAYQVCPICVWEDDGSPDGSYGVGGPNGYSLVHGQRRYLAERRAHDDVPPDFCARSPRADEPRDGAWVPHPDSRRSDLVLGWTTLQGTVEILSQVAALTGASLTDVETADVVLRLTTTNVYDGDVLDWRPGESTGVLVSLAVDEGDGDVLVRVVTDGDDRLAERLRGLLDSAVP